MPISIFLADDHQIVRQGLHTLFSAEADLSVIGESADGLDTLAQVEKLQPDVLVLDLMLPGLSGLEVTRRVTQAAPTTRTLILSMHANEAYVLEALRNGAAGYVLKDAPISVVLHGVREVAAGRRYLSPTLSDRAIASYIQKSEAAPLDPYNTLTSREREVLQLAAEGLSNQEIGERLFISPRTAESHRFNLMHKLSLKTQSELIRYALRRGLLPMDQ
jgi:DNA-binding NarL/FixJ family response regulator